MKRRRPIPLPVIDISRCTGCGWCVGACPHHLLSLEVNHWKKSSVLGNAAACTGCSLCEVKCPVRAITMQLPQKRTEPEPVCES